MFHKNRVLVVAAHPDDEMLGCGGTLARLKAGGAQITIILLGEGPTSRLSEGQDSAKNEAASSAVAAAAILGLDKVHLGGFPDNRFDTVAMLDIVRKIEAIGRQVAPELIFTHHWGDLNIDHRRTHQAVMTAFRPLPGSEKRSILGFEIPSSTEYSPPSPEGAFNPNVFADITEFWDLKQKALTAYASEMRPWPHPRSYEGVEHLARLRGSQCGVDAAEAFVLIRKVF